MYKYEKLIGKMLEKSGLVETLALPQRESSLARRRRAALQSARLDFPEVETARGAAAWAVGAGAGTLAGG